MPPSLPHPPGSLALMLLLAVAIGVPAWPTHGSASAEGVGAPPPATGEVRDRSVADADDDPVVVERDPNGREDGDDIVEPGPTVGQRVHIIVDRRTTVQGTIELEGEDVIVVRVRDELRTLSKGRVHRIVRLVEPGEGGHPGIVFLTDGRVRRGTVVEDGFEQVVLSIEGIRTVIPRADVDFVELEPTFDERIALFRAAIGPHDHLRRLELARWLFSERRYELAHAELVTIVEQAELPEARRLLHLVAAQLVLQEGRRADPTERSAPGGLREQSRRGLPTQVLTADDVNIIRVYELDLDRSPRLTITQDTIHRLAERYGASELVPTGAGRMAMLRADPVDVARLMFQLRARDFYPEIQVNGEPHHLSLFRQRVHNAWLIPNCSTSRCHGGADGGAFFMHTENHKEDRVRYTNLLILDQTRIDGRPLIDYEDPIMSLIVQHALPRHHARLPHPDVRGWRPVLTEGNRRLLDDTLTWIRSMHLPRPLYPIDYEPPVLERRGGRAADDGRGRTGIGGVRVDDQDR